MAFTPQWLTGFEHQTVSAAGGGLCAAVQGAGVKTIVTSGMRSGLAALQVARTATTAGCLDVTIAANKHVTRFGFKHTALPAGGAICQFIRYVVGAQRPGIRINNSGVISASLDGTNWTNGPTLTTATWYVIEIALDTSGTTWTLDWRVDTADKTQVTLGSQVNTNATKVEICGANVLNEGALTAVFDDFLMGTWTSLPGDWPGPGYSLAYKPNASGVHSVGSATFRFTDNNGGAFTNIANSETVSHSRVATWPNIADGNAGDDWIEKFAGTSATDYVDYEFENCSETGVKVNAVRAIAAIKASATQGNILTLNLEVSDTEHATAIFSATVGSTTSLYKAQTFEANPSSAAWSTTNVSNTGIRFKSTDVSPIPQVKALLLEVDFKLLFSGDSTGTQAAQTEAATGKLRFTGTSTESQASQAEAATAKERFTATATETQAAQTEAATAKERFTATATQTQAAQSEAATATTRLILTGTETQAAQTESATASLRFLAAATEAQTAQTESGTGTIPVNFIGNATETQASQSEAATAALRFLATATETQAANTEAATAKESFLATASETQAAQSQNATATERFTSTSTETQASQSEAATASLLFRGTATQAQASQTEASTAKEIFASTGTETQGANTEAATAKLRFLASSTSTQAAQTQSGFGPVDAYAGDSTQTQAAQTQAATATNTPFVPDETLEPSVGSGRRLPKRKRKKIQLEQVRISGVGAQRQIVPRQLGYGFVIPQAIFGGGISAQSLPLEEGIAEHIDHELINAAEAFLKSHLLVTKAEEVEWTTYQRVREIAGNNAELLEAIENWGDAMVALRDDELLKAVEGWSEALVALRAERKT